MSSDFIAGRVTRKISFLPFLHFLWCMTQRSQHAITKVYHRSVSCFATISRVDMRYHDPACNAKVSSGRYAIPRPLLHSSEQDTQPTIFLISKQATPYRTCGGTCCPGVSTPMNRTLADSSTTCHDGINHLHHSNHCSNHSMDPHTVKSHLKWMVDYISHTKAQAKLNITKVERLVQHS
jgi:hypothetical protein